MECPQCRDNETVCEETNEPTNKNNNCICDICNELFSCDHNFYFIKINILNDRKRSLYQLAQNTIKLAFRKIYSQVSRNAATNPISFIFDTFFLCVLGYFLIRLLLSHYKIIVNPFQNEFREGAILLSTKALFAGINPYDLENQPQYTNVYGIFYNLIVYPFAKIFGLNLPVHRVVTAFFIGSSCIGLFALMYKKMQISLLLCLSASTILYAQLIYLVSPLARPDSLGLFLFLCGLYIPYRYSFSRPSLILSIALGILGLLTKPYFFLLIPYIFLYLFIFKSKLKGIKYGSLSLIVLFVTVIITNTIFESYFNNTFFAHLNAPIGNDLLNDPYFSVIQFRSYIQHNLGFSIICGVLFLLWIMSRFVGFLQTVLKTIKINSQIEINVFDRLKAMNYFCNFPKISIDFIHLNSPLVKNDNLVDIILEEIDPEEEIDVDLNLNFIIFCLVVSLFIFFVRMGHHRGNWLIYIHQLISPFLIIAVFKLVDRQWKLPLSLPKLLSFKSNLITSLLKEIPQTLYRLIFACLIILNLCTLTTNDFLYDFNYGTKIWIELRHLIAEHKNIFNSPALTTLLIEQDKPVYDSGLSEYFSDGIKSRKVIGIPFPIDQKAKDHFTDFRRKTEENIRTKQFDMIILSQNYSPFISEDFVNKYYRQTQTVSAPMLFTLQNYELNVWEPR